MIFFLFLSLIAMDDSHKKGLSFVKDKIEDVKKKATSTSPSNIPGFKTDCPQEASITKDFIQDLSHQESKKNPVSSYILEHASKRKKYHIDTQKDPLILNAKQAVKDPHKAMNEIIIEEQKNESESEMITCEEGGEAYIQTCQKNLSVVLKITPEISKKCRKCPGHEKDSGFMGWGSKTVYCNPGCQSFKKIIQKKKVEIESETWIDDCLTLEDHADHGLCHYVLKTQGPKETKIIQGEKVERDHWHETLTYECFKKTDDQCSSLRAKGCLQIKSECLEKIGNVCISYLQTYQCQKPFVKGKIYKTTGEKSPFCLTGNCENSDFEANTEMLQAMTHLSFLKQAQNDIRRWNCIFKGEARSCTKNCVGFRDCCKTGKGWGVSLGLSSCSLEEKELGSLRNQKRCVLIGTYCVEKVLKQCIRKKTVFCCFGTKLSRLIQEAGHKQLKLSWGEAESPNCRGLSPEELSRLDLSKMDLSELYEDIAKNFKPQTNINLDRLKENMSYMTRRLS
jgi:hypothetical protein